VSLHLPSPRVSFLSKVICLFVFLTLAIYCTAAKVKVAIQQPKPGMGFSLCQRHVYFMLSLFLLNRIIPNTAGVFTYTFIFGSPSQ